MLEIDQLDPAKCLSAPGLARNADLKMTQVKLKLASAINSWKSVRGGLFEWNKRYARANKKYMKDYDKNKELPYLKY